MSSFVHRHLCFVGFVFSLESLIGSLQQDSESRLLRVTVIKHHIYRNINLELKAE